MESDETNAYKFEKRNRDDVSLLVYICGANINLTHIVAVYSKDTPWTYDAPIMKD